MKIITLSLISAALLLSACHKDKFTSESAFEKSYSVWKNSTYRIENEYRYDVVRDSADREFYTSIVIQNGVVTSRDYDDYQRIGTNGFLTVKSWYEDQQSINTHKEGAPGITLDAVYDKARNEWLTADPKTNDVEFATDNFGLIALAGYTPYACKGDCFVGIKLASVGPIKPMMW